jgi:hypothetical protein
MNKLSVLMFVLIAITRMGYSQDLNAGEMTLKHIAGYTYESNISFYYQSSLFSARPFILLNWGDGPQSDTLFYPGNSSFCGDSSTTLVKYIGTHTYPGIGTYILSCIDSFRIANLQNVTNCSNESMYLVDTLNIGTFWNANSSPVSANCPVENWQCCNWIYNPASTDSDGDSLAYNLVHPRTTNYVFPSASVDNMTGDMTFNPTTTGVYAFCMNIEEWRKVNSNYYLVGTTFRQMCIYVNSLLSINEINVQNPIQISPNPSSDFILVNYESKTKHPQFEIFDVTGRIVLTTQEIQKQIDISYLPEGLYLLKVTDGDLHFSKRFVKQ